MRWKSSTTLVMCLLVVAGCQRQAPPRITDDAGRVESAFTAAQTNIDLQVAVVRDALAGVDVSTMTDKKAVSNNLVITGIAGLL